MKILIDAHMIGGRETGNETYIKNLILGFDGLEEAHVGAAMVPSAPHPQALQQAQAELLTLSPSHDLARLLYTLPKLAKTWRAQILHTTYTAPLFLPCPTVISVHDVSFKRFPDFFSARDRVLFTTLLPLSLRRAAAILTLSEHAKSEILTFYPFLKDKVFVTPLAADLIYQQRHTNSNQIRQKYGLEQDYLLAVGNLQPRKNLLRLIRAYAACYEQIRPSQLAIVGKNLWQSSQVHQLTSELALDDKIVFTGYVPEDDLVALYQEAQAFIYPSLYEGFGLPILEAMSCGTPVITSNTSSMPSVAGKAALYIDPSSVESIADGIVQMMTDPVKRQTLKKKALAQSKTFSWRQTAKQTLSVYHQVLANGQR